MRGFEHKCIWQENSEESRRHNSDSKREIGQFFPKGKCKQAGFLFSGTVRVAAYCFHINFSKFIKQNYLALDINKIHISSNVP